MFTMIQTHNKQSNSSSYHPSYDIQNYDFESFHISKNINNRYGELLGDKLTKSQIEKLKEDMSSYYQTMPYATSCIEILFKFCDFKTGITYASQKTMAAHKGITVRTLIKYFNLFEERGFITRKRKGHLQSNDTTLLAIPHLFRKLSERRSSNLDLTNSSHRDIKNKASYDEHFNFLKEEDKKRQADRCAKRKKFFQKPKTVSIEDRGSCKETDLSKYVKFTKEEEIRITPVSIAQLAQMRAAIGGYHG